MSKIIAEIRTTAAKLKSEHVYYNTIFGNRMKEAREVAGYDQVMAAKLMGYSGSSGLSQIESGKYTGRIPSWVPPKAADVYMVSIDYLYGKSEDWERDPVVSQQRDVNSFLMEHWAKAKAAEINAIRILNNKITTLELAASNAITNARRNNEILIKFRELNPSFDDMKMGARLVRAADESLADANKVIAELRRYHCFLVAGKASNVAVKNADIFDYECAE
ncbi:MAG: hypothetical protein RIR39_1671 [Pseudomonadota bacterium]